MDQLPLPPGRSRPSSTAILVGGLVGGVFGGLIRGWFTSQNLQPSGLFELLVSLPSASIGLLCGAIAGAFCRPLLGALVGAGLSAGVFGLFLLPIGYLLALVGAPFVVAEFSWPFLLQKAVAGAIAGAIGGLVGQWFDRRHDHHRPPRDPASVTVDESDA
jgi:hypothetical protein